MRSLPKPKIVWGCLAGSSALLFLTLMVLVLVVDVQPAGAAATRVGCATVNGWFWHVTQVNTWADTVSQWCGYLTILLAAGVVVGQGVWLLRQRRWRALPRHWWFFDGALVALMLVYVVFEVVVINCRPILVDGVAKSSFPSTHVMLFVTVLPLCMVGLWRLPIPRWGQILGTVGLAVLLVLGVFCRTLCGWHWLTDIVAGILAGLTLFFGYLALTFQARVL